MRGNILLNSNLLIEQSSGYEYANGGQRLANFLIDQTIVSVIYFTVATILSTSFSFIFKEASKANIYFTSIAVAINLGYYILLEGIGGKTIGKYITRTRVLSTDGQPVTFKKALVRSLCRMLPCEPFSFLSRSNGWHDSMTDTIVVKDRRQSATHTSNN